MGQVARAHEYAPTSAAPVILISCAGLGLDLVGFAIYGLAPTGPIFWIGVPVMALWGIATPSVQTLMTRLVDGSQQGRLQGALASLTGLASLIGPTVFTQTFAVFISARSEWFFPGAPFLLAALLVFAAMLLAWRTTQPPGVSAASEAG